jgi:hypothetical protein
MNEAILSCMQFSFILVRSYKIYVNLFVVSSLYNYSRRMFDDTISSKYSFLTQSAFYHTKRVISSCFDILNQIKKCFVFFRTLKNYKDVVLLRKDVNRNDKLSHLNVV